MHAFEFLDLVPEQQFKRKRFWSRLMYITAACLLLALFLYNVYELIAEVPERKLRWVPYILYGYLLIVNYKHALFPKQVKNKFLVDNNSIIVDQQYAKGFSLNWAEVVKVQMNFSAIRLFTDSNQYQEFDTSKLDHTLKKSLRKTIYAIVQEKQIPIEIPSSIKDNLLQ